MSSAVVVLLRCRPLDKLCAGPKLWLKKQKRYAKKIVYYKYVTLGSVNSILNWIKPDFCSLELGIKWKRATAFGLKTRAAGYRIHMVTKWGEKKTRQTLGLKLCFLFLMPVALPIEFLNLIFFFLYSRIQLEGHLLHKCLYPILCNFPSNNRTRT